MSLQSEIDQLRERILDLENKNKDLIYGIFELHSNVTRILMVFGEKIKIDASESLPQNPETLESIMKLIVYNFSTLFPSFMKVIQEYIHSENMRNKDKGIH